MFSPTHSHGKFGTHNRTMGCKNNGLWKSISKYIHIYLFLFCMLKSVSFVEKYMYMAITLGPSILNGNNVYKMPGS